MILEKRKLAWAKTVPNAIIPTKKTEDAGYDIYPCFEEDYISIPPHETRLIPTGIAVAVSEDYYLQIEERGSTGSKGIKKSAGIIDSGFRGSIFVAISNVNDKEIIISKLPVPQNESGGNDAIIYPYKKAIAQVIVHRVHKMDEIILTYEELMKIPSSRGNGALGSSGK